MSDLLSPLHGHLKPGRLGMPEGAPGVTLAERPLASLVQVAAWPDSLDEVAARLAEEIGGGIEMPALGRVLRGDSGTLMALAPGRFLIEGDAPGLAERLAAAIPAQAAAVTDLTHGRTCLALEGSAAAWVLAKGAALDFGLAAFPVGRVAQSAIHEIGVTIGRSAEEAFTLYVFRSFALSLFEWLSDAALETGCRVEG